MFNKPKDESMILQNLYNEARLCNDPDRLRTIYASVSKRSNLIVRYPNDCRLVARAVAENPSADNDLLCEIIRHDSLEVCYCAANNINIGEAPLGDLYNRLIHFMPNPLPPEGDDSLWTLAVKSMIKNDNINADMLLLLAEGSFGPIVAGIAKKQIKEITN